MKITWLIVVLIAVGIILSCAEGLQGPPGLDGAPGIPGNDGTAGTDGSTLPGGDRSCLQRYGRAAGQ